MIEGGVCSLEVGFGGKFYTHSAIELKKLIDLIL